MATDAEKRKINLRYQMPPDYKVYAVTGAHGGPNSDGSFLMNLFYERGPMATERELILSSEGKVIKEGEAIEVEGAQQRVVMFGVSMNMLTAKSIAAWMLKTIAEWEQFNKAAQQGEQGDSQSS